MTSPCMDCKERSLNCHALCDHYREWTEAQHKIKEARAKMWAKSKMTASKEKSIIKSWKK